MDLITYIYFEYFLRDFLLAFDEEIVQCVVQFARKVTTILIFVLCVHKKIWVCHKTSSMSNLNNVYARSLQHVKFGRTPCNFIFMRNHVFFFSFLRCCCCCFPLSDNNNRFISLYGHSCEPYIISRRTRRKRGNFLCC